MPAPASSSPLRALALAVYAPSFLVAIGQQGILIMLPLYALELGGGAAAAATWLGLRGLGTVVSDVPCGAAISRFGDKRTMLGGLLVLATAGAGLGFADRLWVAAALAFLFGSGVGAWMLARVHHVAEHTPPAWRGRAMTVMAGIQRLGAFLGPALGGLTVKLWGYEVLFLGAAGLALLGLLLVLLFTRPAPAEALTTHPPFGALARIVREHGRVFATAGLAAICLQFVRAGRQLLVPLWGNAIGLDEAQIGLAFGLSSALDMVMFYPAGWLMDFRGRKWTFVPSALVLGASLGLLVLTGGWWSFLAVTVLSGFGNGLGTGVVMTLGADLSPPEHRGEFLGVWRLVGDLGMAAGPFLMGAAAAGLSLAGALVVGAGAGLAGGLVMAFGVRETLRRRGG